MLTAGGATDSVVPHFFGEIKSTAQPPYQPSRADHRDQDDQVRDQTSKHGIFEADQGTWHRCGEHDSDEHDTQNQRNNAPCNGCGTLHGDDQRNQQADAERVGQLRYNEINQLISSTF
jgi:hypothetical protein